MKSLFTNTISKVSPQMIRLFLLTMTLVLFVLAAGAPGIVGGVGG